MEVENRVEMILFCHLISFHFLYVLDSAAHTYSITAWTSLNKDVGTLVCYHEARVPNTYKRLFSSHFLATTYHDHGTTFSSLLLILCLPIARSSTHTITLYYRLSVWHYLRSIEASTATETLRCSIYLSQSLLWSSLSCVNVSINPTTIIISHDHFAHSLWLAAYFPFEVLITCPFALLIVFPRKLHFSAMTMPLFCTHFHFRNTYI